MPKVCVDVDKELYEDLRRYYPPHSGFSHKMRNVWRKMIDIERKRESELERPFAKKSTRDVRR